MALDFVIVKWKKKKDTDISCVRSQDFAHRVLEFPKTWAIDAHRWKTKNQWPRETPVFPFSSWGDPHVPRILLSFLKAKNTPYYSCNKVQPSSLCLSRHSSGGMLTRFDALNSWYGAWCCIQFSLDLRSSVTSLVDSSPWQGMEMRGA